MLHRFAHMTQTQPHLRSRSHGQRFAHCSAMPSAGRDSMRDLGNMPVSATVHMRSGLAPWVNQMTQGVFRTFLVRVGKYECTSYRRDEFTNRCARFCQETNLAHAKVVFEGNTTPAIRKITLCQGELPCARNTELEGSVPTNRNTDHLTAVRVHTQTVESPWKVIR
jgi:hypothetical protein